MEINVEVMRQEFKEQDRIRDLGLQEPHDQLTIIKDLAYGDQTPDHLLDIYYPNNTKTPLPTIINIHGGGFFYGDKELYRFYTMYLATHGFTVINFNYRLAPKYKYPAPLEDINQLMHWVNKHQHHYPIDLDHIFLVGDSAGAQLAEQYTTILTNPNYAALFPFSAPKIIPTAIGLNCGLYFIGKDQAINQDFPFYFGTTRSEHIQKQFPVENFIDHHFPPAFLTTASHDFLKDLAYPLSEHIIHCGGQSHYQCYQSWDLTELHHVFHLDLRNSIGIECNRDMIAFFKTFI